MPWAGSRRLVVMVILVAVVSSTVALVWAFSTWPTIDQGVYGVVTLAEGDCMPVAPPFCEKRSAVSRTIWVREPVPGGVLSDPSILGSYPLVVQTVSGWTGFYQLRLPPGEYSIFVADGDSPYCRVVVDDTACPLSVGTGVSRYDILISHVTM